MRLAPACAGSIVLPLSPSGNREPSASSVRKYVGSKIEWAHGSAIRSFETSFLSPATIITAGERSRVDFAKLAMNRAASLRSSPRGPSRFYCSTSRAASCRGRSSAADIVSTRTLAQREPVRQFHSRSAVGCPGDPRAGRANPVDRRRLRTCRAHRRARAGDFDRAGVVCHGLVGGPILVDSSMRRLPSAAAVPTTRTPPRTRTCSTNMSAGEHRLFRARFARRMVATSVRFARIPPPSAMSSISLPQSDPGHDRDHVYEFVFDGGQLSNHRATDHGFFGSNSPTVTRSLARCQACLRRRANASCSQKIANIAGVGCWGAVPGTYSSYAQGVPFPVLFIGRGVPGNRKDFAHLASSPRASA